MVKQIYLKRWAYLDRWGAIFLREQDCGIPGSHFWSSEKFRQCIRGLAQRANGIINLTNRGALLKETYLVSGIQWSDSDTCTLNERGFARLARRKRAFQTRANSIYKGREVSEHSPSLFNKYVLYAYYAPHTVNEADLEKRWAAAYGWSMLEEKDERWV